MSRKRTIKPGFFTDEDLGGLKPLERLAFAGLWCHADREGKLKEKTNELKIQILPYDKCDFEAILDSLETKGFIVRYEINGEKLIHIPTFLNHQSPHAREMDSTIPNPLKNNTSTEKEPPRRCQGTTQAMPRHDLGFHTPPHPPIDTEYMYNNKKGVVKGENKKVQEIVDFFLKFGTNLPKPRINKDGTLQSVSISNDIKKCLRVIGWKELFKAAVKHANECPFALGDNGRGWKLTLRWMVENTKKVDKVFDWPLTKPTKDPTKIEDTRTPEQKRRATEDGKLLRERINVESEAETKRLEEISIAFRKLPEEKRQEYIARAERRLGVAAEGKEMPQAVIMGHAESIFGDERAKNA